MPDRTLYNIVPISFPHKMQKYTFPIIVSIIFAWLTTITVILISKKTSGLTAESVVYLEQTGKIVTQYPNLLEYCKTQKCQ